MVKFCHEKMLILRCILPPLPPKKIEPPPEKNLNLPPSGKSRTPCQETQLTGNNFNSLKKTLSLWKNINIPTKKLKSKRKTSFSTTQKSLNHHEKASTPTLENFSISPKTPPEKCSTP